MHVIEVIPMMKATGVESLSYYSSKDYLPGTVLEVPVRKKMVRALVIGSTPAASARTAVRAATFTLRKLPSDTKNYPLSPVLIETAKRLKEATPASLGAILYSLIPKEVRQGEAELASNLPCLGVVTSPSISILQALIEERYRVYRSKIREAFAHNESVLFVVPTTTQMEQAIDLLSQGIEERVILLSSNLTPRKNQQAYKELTDTSQAKLIIVTPSHAYIDRHDLSHVIIENARSTHYKSRYRPYLDSREVLKTMAGITNRNILMGDLLPRTEEEMQRREDIYATEGEHPKRLVFPGSLKYIEQDPNKDIGRDFRIISDTLKNQIEDTLSKRKNVFIYSARRGLSPLIICIDCGHIARCPESGAPYSLIRTFANGAEKRWFVCPVSGMRERASDTCRHCGSWRLTERGIGIQQIEDNLKTLFPEHTLMVFDHTTIKTHRQAKILMGKFYGSKGALLLGTAMALPYLNEPVERSVITSLDAARAIPTWRADEELLSLILRLREITAGEVSIQTRTEIDELLKHAKDGTVEQFYTEESALREAVAYPPSAKLIHITIKGNPEDIKTYEEKITDLVSPISISFYSPLSAAESEQVRYGMMRINTHEWPNEELLEKLRTLPPSVRIEIDPHRLI